MPIEKLLVEFESQAMMVAFELARHGSICLAVTSSECRHLDFLRRAIESACACERQRAAALSPSFG